jgi:hypothetical protein
MGVSSVYIFFPQITLIFADVLLAFIRGRKFAFPEFPTAERRPYEAKQVRMDGFLISNIISIPFQL